MGYIERMALKPPWEVRYLSNLLPQTLISQSYFKIFRHGPPLKLKEFLRPNYGNPYAGGVHEQALRTD